MIDRDGKFSIGQVVRHRVHPFRGVIFDVDPTFSNSDEWWESIPEASRPKKEQPYYHLLAVGSRGPYVAYVSEQNLVPDPEGGPIVHPQVAEIFGSLSNGFYALHRHRAN